MRAKIISDKDFDAHCPADIKRLATEHWTPVGIARRSAKFLTKMTRARVLDIGSGIGKFCITGAAFTEGVFTGVEQREDLCNLARKIALLYELPNARFIHANITKIDFGNYDAFFFYNSFYENIEQTTAIDKSVHLNESLFQLYNRYVFEQLSKMPAGTRLVTYWGDFEVPPTYELAYCNGCDSLKFWEKHE